MCIEDVGTFLKVVSGAEEEGSIVDIEELREVEGVKQNNFFEN